jgi:hypothetical protein
MSATQIGPTKQYRQRRRFGSHPGGERPRRVRRHPGRREAHAGGLPADYRRNSIANIRKITRVWQSKPTLEGAGVRLHRAFGYDQGPQFDPLLILDDFRGDDPADYLKGFPWHPHRGIETITYVLTGEATKE